MGNSPRNGSSPNFDGTFITWKIRSGRIIASFVMTDFRERNDI